MLTTNYAVGETPLSEYPRPQFRRESYVCLNGVWEFQKRKSGGQVCDERVESFRESGGQVCDEYMDGYRKILVPFSPESYLSGVESGFALGDDECLFYRRTFTVTDEQAGKVAMLHFGAVDQSCRVFVNGEFAGKHDGGYVPFALDITKLVRVGENELTVECVDTTEKSGFTRGKQSSNAGTIWYTKQSGIWQSVWMEFLPQKHIRDFTIKTDAFTKTVTIDVDCVGDCGDITLTVYDGGQAMLTTRFVGRAVVEGDFELWSPENPKLYDFTLEYGADKVSSYFGVRTFSEETDKKGRKRLCLNGKPCFMSGVLDQGYWPDGLLTPPSNKAMYDELKLLKEMGFNMVRKHIKVEPMLWYRYCDELGLIVWQDFVNGGGEYQWTHIALFPFLGAKHRDSDYKYFARENEGGRVEFIASAKATVMALKNAPCVGLWTPFNEGWGQFDSAKMVEMLREWDDTRLIDSCSGWHDQGKRKTTMKSMHTYYTPLCAPRDSRPVVLSEFGGYSKKTEGHVYSEKEFGYKIFKTDAELHSAIKKLYLKKLKPLIKRGLCASVYTQVSDVEEEINGLVTYDRKVVKIPASMMKALNDELMAEMQEIEL